VWQSYWEVLKSSPLDWFILFVAGILCIAHVVGLIMRLSGKKVLFVQDLDQFREICLFLTEILPLLGLLGTVLSILHTFRQFALDSTGPADFSRVIESFAPALSTTVSGLMGSVVNLVLNAALWLASPVSRSNVSDEIN